MAFILAAVAGYFFVKKGSEVIDKTMEVTIDTVSSVQSVASNIIDTPSRMKAEYDRQEYSKKSEIIRAKYSKNHL